MQPLRMTKMMISIINQEERAKELLNQDHWMPVQILSMEFHHLKSSVSHQISSNVIKCQLTYTFLTIVFQRIFSFLAKPNQIQQSCDQLAKIKLDESARKSSRKWEMWTEDDTKWFFEALCEVKITMIKLFSQFNF